MKKIISIIALVLSTVAYAQDTVTYGYYKYLFSSPMPGMCYGGVPSIIDGQIPVPAAHIAQGFKAQGSLMVYGVAVVTDYATRSSDHIYYDSIDSLKSTSDCFFASLLVPGDSAGTTRLVDTARLKYPSNRRYFEYSGIHQSGSIRSTVYPCHEFYFDRPHLIPDSLGIFYVGAKIARGVPFIDDPCKIIELEGRRIAYGTYPVFAYDTVNANIWINFPDASDFTHYTEGYESYLEFALATFGVPNLGLWGFVFPILYPQDTICRAPHYTVWIDTVWADGAVLSWDTIYDRVELAIGPAGTDPDDAGTVVSLPPGSTGYAITGLQPGAAYRAWLRRECHWVTPTYNTTAMSEWTDAAIFIADTAAAGIGRAGELRFGLSPNPAHGAFEVATDALPATLTLFDPQGRTVYSATLRAARTTIGTADLPHGIYHVVVATADGRSATRRLVIE